MRHRRPCLRPRIHDLVVEIAREDEVGITEQQEYRHLEVKIGRKFAEVAKCPGFQVTGMSQGRVWIGCTDQETVDHIIKSVPSIPPFKENGGKYIAYGPGDKKPTIVKVMKVPASLWDDFEYLLLNTNRCFIDRIEHEVLGSVEPKIKVSGGMTDKKKDITMDSECGYFFPTLAMDELTFEELAKAGGRVRIGFSTYECTGSGMERRVKEIKEEKEKKERENVINIDG